MKLVSTSFKHGDAIPPRFAFGKMDPNSHVALSDNVNPHMAWGDAPAGTQSFVLVCHDYDVPSKGDDVNQEGKAVPASLPRVDFFHWLLLDIPATVNEIAEGSQSAGITARGKAGPAAAEGLRHGINDYTAWFHGDADMGGTYYGYDGPCPPWNDEILHHYVFTVYALDVPGIEVKGSLTGQNILDALDGHILGLASMEGTYTLNPAVAG